MANKSDSVIIDSQMTAAQAILQNPDRFCPIEIFERQRLVDVNYFSFDDKYHIGQVVVDRDLVTDIKEIFAALLEEKFPITSVIPIADPRFHWDDETSMQANNSSEFNYRLVARTTRLSNHALGLAVDINTKLNPFIKGDFVQPENREL